MMLSPGGHDLPLLCPCRTRVPSASRARSASTPGMALPIEPNFSRSRSGGTQASRAEASVCPYMTKSLIAVGQGLADAAGQSRASWRRRPG